MNEGKAQLLGICPHFIVKEYRASVDYYHHKLRPIRRHPWSLHLSCAGVIV
jgi:hypothetical protein